jgi:thioredoxin:protein disulfide reductase
MTIEKTVLIVSTFFCWVLLLLPSTPIRAEQPSLQGGALELRLDDASMKEEQASADERGAGSIEDRLKESLQKVLEGGGVLVALLISWLAGLITSLMGCVYPLIPVVMAIIGTRETKSRYGALRLSSVYLLGVCVLYSSLGLAFALLGKGFGSWMGSPWVMGLIAVFFMAMGLSMFGFYEFRLPSFLEQRIQRAGGKGFVGAFLAGLVSGLVAAPCTGPVLSVILVFIMQSQDALFGFWLLFFFGLGFGTLFLVVGTFSGVMSHLPKSGPWMEGIKCGFGTIMVGMALYFLRPLIPEVDKAVASIPLPWGVGLAGFLLMLISRAFRTPFFSLTPRGKRRKAGALSLGALSVFLIAAGLSVAKNSVQWVKDVDRGISEAKANAQPVMLDFWATWCQACLHLDRQTFSNPEVAEELERFVSIKVDCTRSVEDESLQKLMDRYEAMDLPTIRFIDSKGKLLDRPVIKGFYSPGRMIKILQAIP